MLDIEDFERKYSAIVNSEQSAQLQEAWAPENPKLAKRLSELASKLRGVPQDHTDVAPAGHHNGPDLWA